MASSLTKKVRGSGLGIERSTHQPVAAVLWDMDGTLIDSEELHQNAIQRVIRSLGFEPPPNLHNHSIGKSPLETHKWLQQALGLPLSFKQWRELKNAYYAAHTASISFRPGAQALWHQLENRGIARAVVSNAEREIVTANLKAVGLTDPELLSICIDDVDAPKPSPEPYLQAAERLGVEPNHCIVIEDSSTGALSGIAAGMRTYFIPQDNGSPPPQGAIKVANFGEIAGLLERDL